MFQLIGGPFPDHRAEGPNGTERGARILMGVLPVKGLDDKERLCVAVYIIEDHAKAAFSHFEAIGSSGL